MFLLSQAIVYNNGLNQVIQLFACSIQLYQVNHWMSWILTVHPSVRSLLWHWVTIICSCDVWTGLHQKFFLLFSYVVYIPEPSQFSVKASGEEEEMLVLFIDRVCSVPPQLLNQWPTNLWHLVYVGQPRRRTPSLKAKTVCSWKIMYCL